ncbi:hypothetical protein N665_0151s0036 [Sinapis alba]|nr:hypothetical protein N665_0151s0036 [Sinapis alba]
MRKPYSASEDKILLLECEVSFLRRPASTYPDCDSRNYKLLVFLFRSPIGLVLNGNINTFWTIQSNPRSSWFLNKILKMRGIVYDWIKLRVGNGITCRFWTDNWSPFGNLQNYFSNDSNYSIKYQKTQHSLHSSESRDHLFFSCSYAWELWFSLSQRCGFSSERNWSAALQQLQRYHSQNWRGRLILLCWQCCLYWVWQERNGRLHRNSSRSVGLIGRLVDRQVRDRILSYRDTNPLLSSRMMQRWLQ